MRYKTKKKKHPRSPNKPFIMHLPFKKGTQTIAFWRHTHSACVRTVRVTGWPREKAINLLSLTNDPQAHDARCIMQWPCVQVHRVPVLIRDVLFLCPPLRRRQRWRREQAKHIETKPKHVIKIHFTSWWRSHALRRNCWSVVGGGVFVTESKLNYGVCWMHRTWYLKRTFVVCLVVFALHFQATGVANQWCVILCLYLVINILF